MFHKFFVLRHLRNWALSFWLRSSNLTLNSSNPFLHLWKWQLRTSSWDFESTVQSFKKPRNDRQITHWFNICWSCWYLTRSLELGNSLLRYWTFDELMLSVNRMKTSHQVITSQIILIAQRIWNWKHWSFKNHLQGFD